MIDPQVVEVARTIGDFYLAKHNGDYAKATEEIYRLQIAKIAVAADNSIVITLGRVGLFIGKRGTNLDAIIKLFNGRQLKVVEDMDSILDYVIPRPPQEC
jgi:transcription antitermination factor NusA-like protein